MSDLYISSIVLETNILNPTPESKKTFTRNSGGLTSFYSSDGSEIIIWESYPNPFTGLDETKWRLRATNNPSGGGFVSLNLVNWSVQPGYVSSAGLVFISLGYRNRNLIKGDGGTGKLIGKGYKMQDSDAKNYIDRIEALEKKMLEPEIRKTIDLFVIGCKTDGIWNKIQHSCILAGARTLNGALLPLKGSAPTNINFIASDYNRKNGLKANGNVNGPIPSATNKMLNTNVNSFSLGIYQHASLYLNEKSTIDGHYLSTLLSSSPNIHTIIGFSASSLKINILNCTSSSSVSTVGNLHKTGFLSVSRSNSTQINFRGDKTNETISSNNLGFPISTTINLFGKYGTISQYTGGVNNTDGRISFYSLGSDLSQNEMIYLDNRISTFMTELNLLNI